ncbi:ATP-binding protein [Nocardioides litoris]|uniref:ATP-binding protein n=1 Tax=Nocardioides litoris TaxID=1926648 RepID=UPI001B8708F9|nr:ATP-binding protein [Nocardioides litoris]
MPLSKPALSLGSGARGVQDARKWVTDTFHDIDRDDLVECAEMAVSEVVTNALLHGAPPIQVRVRGTREHPRVEVSDGSVEPPALPDLPGHSVGSAADDDSHDLLGLDDLDDLDLDGVEDMLLTFGRGLSIVARAADAWGAEIEPDGKTVWFTPAPDFSDLGSEGVITGAPDLGVTTGELPVDPVELHLLGTPTRDYISFHNHFRELRREVRLLALANEDDYPLARDLAEVFHQLGRPFTHDGVRRTVDRAAAEGRSTTDLDVVMARSDARDVARLVELLDLTDAFAREERMLALARTPRQVAFQSWFLGELVRQAEGDPPRAWREPSAPQAGQSVPSAVERRSIVS